MPLPISFTGIITSQRDVAEFPDSTPENLVTRFRESLNTDKYFNIDTHGGTIYYTSRYSIFDIPYKISITFNTGKEFKARYTVQFIELLFITLGVLFVVSFISRFTVSHFLWFAGIFALIFYFINAAYAVSTVTNAIKALAEFKDYEFEHAESFAGQQQEWMQNPNKCPACGTDVSIYHYYCPECGLKLPGKRKPHPANASKYKFKHIQYHPTSPKNKDEPPNSGIKS